MESDKKLLQQEITAPAQQQQKKIQQRYDELKQYGRRLCLRIDSVPKQNNEKAENIFKFVKGLKVCKFIIVRFTTFRHRAAFYIA